MKLAFWERQIYYIIIINWWVRERRQSLWCGAVRDRDCPFIIMLTSPYPSHTFSSNTFHHSEFFTTSLFSFSFSFFLLSLASNDANHQKCTNPFTLKHPIFKPETALNKASFHPLSHPIWLATVTSFSISLFSHFQHNANTLCPSSETIKIY